MSSILGLLDTAFFPQNKASLSGKWRNSLDWVLKKCSHCIPPYMMTELFFQFVPYHHHHSRQSTTQDNPPHKKVIFFSCEDNMCFTGEMSAAFAAIGLFSAWWVYSKTSNFELASGIFFFFTMEFLQFIQYLFIAPELTDGSDPTSPCENSINKFLTILGFLHICLQPYFCHVINSSLTKSCKYKGSFYGLCELHF